MKIRKDYLTKSKRKRFWQSVLFLLAVLTMCIYLGWRIFFTLPFGEGIFQVIFGILLILAECVTTMTTFELFWRKTKSDRFELSLPEIPDEYYPDVDVFIATHNEPTELLYKTANACTFMDYPDRNKVHIYFADDSNRPEVAELAKELGIGYLGLAENREAKSGNLNHALSCTSSPLVATFDADMIPQHRFLMETVPYFMLPKFILDEETGKWRLRREDEVDEKFKVGLIQTPQSFYNPDLFQFNLYAEKRVPNEQDFFSREVNIMRNSSNASAYTGSNTVIARKALEDIGGFPLKTITEDFETSVRLQKEGYLTYATSKPLAAGLSTTTVPAMMKQRCRWARGVIQSIQNTNAVFTSKLPLGARITYLNAFLYWWSFFNRIIFILAPIMFALFDFRVVNCNFWQLMIFWLPSWIFYSYSMRFLSTNVRNQRWSQIIDTTLAPSLIIPVFLETIFIHERTFKVTNKKKETSKTGSLRYMWFHLLLIGLSIAALIRFMRGKYGMALFYSSVIIFWLSYNLVSLLYAVFFMLGRSMPRKADRISGEEEAQIFYNGRIIPAKTVDFSDTGVAFKSQEKVDIPQVKRSGEEYEIPENGRFEAEIRTGRYKARLKCSLVYRMEQDDNWHYACMTEPASAEDKRQYCQIVYDRDHSLPREMDLWNTAYDDMVRNAKNRIQQMLRRLGGDRQ